MKSTSRPRMRQDSGTRWRHGWHMLARQAAGVSGRPKHRAYRAPATYGRGPRPTDLMSAAAVESRQTCERRTKKLTPDLRSSLAAPWLSLGLRVVLPAVHDRRHCALG